MLKSIHIPGAFLILAITFALSCAWVSTAKPDGVQVTNVPSQLSVRLTDLQDMDTRERDNLMVADLSSWTPQRRQDALEQSREKQCLAEAVYYEARSETLAGQKAVAEVIMNRVKSRLYPNTVCGVVYEGAERSTGCQFSFTCDGSMDRVPYGKYWTRSQEVAALAITHGFTPMTKRATHYHTTAVNPYWSKKLKKTDQYGTHVFYRFKTRRELREGTSTITLAPPPS